MGKVIVVTGAGGMLCGTLAKALAREGHKIAILDLRKEAADTIAEEIKQAGGIALGLSANVLDKTSLEKAQKLINEQLGPCDVLINGADGNHPSGTTSNTHLLEQDLTNKTDNFRTFFDLDPDGIKFVFDLNFMGTLIPTQVFAKDMIGKPRM